MSTQPADVTFGPGNREVRVLHVDDDPAFRELTADVLATEAQYLTVETEGSADDALERLVTEQFDCIVSDYDMPGMDGIEFLEAVRETSPDIPFILFTGKGTEAVASEAFSAGATDYFQKESGTDQYTVLANRITTVVENYHARTQRRRQFAAIETAREGISILDEDGYFVYVNNAYADIYGYGPEEMVGEHWELIYPEDEVSFARNEILPVVQNQGYWNGQTTGLRADGSTFPEDHAVSATDAGGMICSVRDISDREAWEREFDRYRTLVEMLTDPVYVIDETGEFVYVNDAFVELTGYEQAEILGAGPELIKDEATAEEAERQLAQILSTDGPDQLQFELKIQPKEGDPIPCEDHMTALPYEGEWFNGSVGILRDLSGSKDRERTLRRYRRLIEALNDPVYALDADGYVTYVNEAWTETFGYDADEITGEHISLLIPDEDLARGEDLISELLSDEHRDTATWELNNLSSDGERRVVENQMTVLTDEEGTFEGTVGLTRDITDRREEAEALKQQNERLNEFASLVSHDLRNPLNIIQSRLTLAQDECDSEHLEAIARGADRMEALIDDLLRLARSGDMIDEREPVRLADLATACWGTVETGDITIVTNTEQVVSADRSRLQQLLENLMRNAVEHGGDVSTITIGDLADGFYVADDGTGIPPDERDDIFEYGHSTSDTGTGYGLAIVRAVVEAHGWGVHVTEGADGGARFEITGVEHV